MKILFILGWERSGSTILAKILDRIPGFFSAGELHHLWEQYVSPTSTCSCGMPVADCEVWSKVLSGRFEGTELRAISGKLASLKVALGPVQNTLKVLRGTSSDVRDYARAVNSAYDHVAQTVDASVVVDSSKVPTRAALLRHMPNVDAYLIHLIRDPRAVAYSWRGRDLAKLRGAILHSTIRWVLWNSAAEFVSRRMPPERRMMVRYEDLFDDPYGTLRRIVAMTNQEFVGSAFTDARTVDLTPGHLVHGNPVRFNYGHTRLERDDEWAAKLPSKDVMFATALSFPLLHRYEYSLMRGARL